MAQDPTEAALEAELDAAVTAEEAAAPEPEIVEQPKPQQLASLLRSNGWDVADDATDEDVVAYIRERDELEERARKAEERAKQLEAWYAQQAKQAQPEQTAAPAAEAAPAKPKREVPEFDPEWESVLKLDEQGNVVRAFDWVDPSIPGKYQRYQKWLKAEQARLLREPAVVLSESGYEDTLKERLLTPYEQRLKAIEERLQQQSQQQLMSQRDQFLVANSHFYAETDAEGKPVLDAQGLLKPNANYQRFVDYEAALEKAGVSDPAERLWLAQLAVPPTPADAEPADPTPAKSKRDVIRNRVNGRIRANGNRLAQPPVRTQRGGGTELVERPASIGQMKNRWLGMLEQAVGGDE
jgi:murein DD-endopeptidase MepM/ murein hydrolase activator NlpD